MAVSECKLLLNYDVQTIMLSCKRLVITIAISVCRRCYKKCNYLASFSLIKIYHLIKLIKIKYIKTLMGSCTLKPE